MASTPDQNIQKVIIERSELPLITTAGDYNLRYRIVTEDGQQRSSWSPKYVVRKKPLYSHTNSDKTILNPEGASTQKYSVDVVEKSHGKSFDVSWKITNTETDLVEMPEQLKDLRYDTYVRWGGLIKSITIGTTEITIVVNYKHNLLKGQKIEIEKASSEDNQQSYIVTDVASTGTMQFRIAKVSPFPYVVGDFVWTPWEFITTTTSNNFSVPIAETHQSTLTEKRYAEFMCHLGTVDKNATESQHETMLFYSVKVSTEAQYDSGSIV